MAVDDALVKKVARATYHRRAAAPSVFEHTDIWGWVYGVPVALGTLLLIFGSDGAKGFGIVLIVGVFGSFILIRAIEAFHNSLDT